MSNPFFTFSSPFVPGQTARSGQANATETQVQTGFDGVYSALQGIMRVVGETHADADFTISENAAARAGKLIGFGVTGNEHVLYAPLLNPRGAWLTLTTYSVGDLVTAGVEQSLYSCLVGHTSDTFATDLAASKWVKILDNTTAYQASFNPKIITAAMSPYLAVKGDDLLVDVTSGAVTINLPASPVLGDQPVGITHLDGTITSNNITVGRNGNNIMAIAQDMVVSTTYATMVLGFSDTARGWRLIRGV